MTCRLFPIIVALLLVGLSIAGPVRAQPERDEARLRAEQQEIDRGAAAGPARFKAEVMARRFHVPVGVVEDLRNRRQGWGEIATRLATAQYLSQTNGKTYATISVALQRVEVLRGEGEGWGAIARELRFKLGPVLSAVRRVKRDLRQETQRPPGNSEEARLKQADKTARAERR